MEYQLIRSRRKTICIQISRTGEVIVRAPMRAALRDIEAFIRAKEPWIKKHVSKRQADPALPPFTAAELRALADRAVKVIPERVKLYAAKMGITYGRITIRAQRTRWGSCSAKGNLNFNCLLMLTPMEVIDSIVVHELAHRKEMNHSARFYEVVREAYPDYKTCEAWLKRNGPQLMRRLTE